VAWGNVGALGKLSLLLSVRTLTERNHAPKVAEAAKSAPRKHLRRAPQYRTQQRNRKPEENNSAESERARRKDFELMRMSRHGSGVRSVIATRKGQGVAQIGIKIKAFLGQIRVGITHEQTRKENSRARADTNF